VRSRVIKSKLVRLTLTHEKLARDSQKIGRLGTQFFHSRQPGNGFVLLHFLENSHQDFVHRQGQIDPGPI
jgi:hypothetical protein